MLSFTHVGDARPHPQIRHPVAHGLSHDSTSPSLPPRPPTAPSAAPAHSKAFRPTFRGREGHGEAKVPREPHSPAPPKNKGSIQPPAGDRLQPRGRTTLPRIRRGAGTTPHPQDARRGRSAQLARAPIGLRGSTRITYSGPWRITSVAPRFLLLFFKPRSQNMYRAMAIVLRCARLLSNALLQRLHFPVAPAVPSAPGPAPRRAEVT